MPRTAPVPAEDDLVDQVVSHSQEELEVEPAVDPSTLFPSGSTMLNLACSDHPRGAYSPGTLVNLVGDKSTGKTMLYYSSLAEIARRKQWKDYLLIHRDIEASVVWNTRALFGSQLAERLEPPKEINTIQDFQEDIGRLIKDGRPFVYGLDSFDSLSDREELKKMIKKLAGDSVKGSYGGVGKTKELGAFLRQTIRELKASGSLLTIISQVRQNMEAGMFEKQLYRTGGMSLGHNTSHEVWLYGSGKIKREFKGKERVIGVNTSPVVEKNRLTGKYRKVSFPIYYDYGIDDIGSCVDWMVSEGFWGKSSQHIDAGDFGSGAKAKIIDCIEQQGLEVELKKAVGTAWLELEEKLKLHRKRRFE